MTLVTRGLGGHSLITRGLGDVWQRVLLLMPAFSTEASLVGASSRSSMGFVKETVSTLGISVKESAGAGSSEAAMSAISTERSLEGSKKAAKMGAESVEQGSEVSSSEATMTYHSREGSMDGETVEPAVPSED